MAASVANSAPFPVDTDGRATNGTLVYGILHVVNAERNQGTQRAQEEAQDEGHHPGLAPRLVTDSGRHHMAPRACGLNRIITKYNLKEMRNQIIIIKLEKNG